MVDLDRKKKIEAELGIDKSLKKIVSDSPKSAFASSLKPATPKPV